MKKIILRRYKWLHIGVLLSIATGTASCMKDFLEERYNFSQVIPESLEDYQAIMDNGMVINYFTASGLGILGGDEIYIRDIIYNANHPTFEKNAYTWQKDIFGTEEVGEWNHAYKRVLHANIVIDGLSDMEIDASEGSTRNSILGSALFVRAFTFFQLSQVFCKQYDPMTSGSDLGIPLRLEADVNIVEKRASLEETFRQIIGDLEKAIPLLPHSTLVRERPNKGAALALLARVYLQQSNYEKALEYAELALSENSTLIDFNDLDNLGQPNPSGSYFTFDGIRETNPEILFMSSSVTLSMVTSFLGGSLTIDTILLKSYAENDLRKQAYFGKRNDTDAFIGSYTGVPLWFTGLAVDELYLIKAESACRLHQLPISLEALNQLLISRYDLTFETIEIADQKLLLERILEERRKELFFRGLRWSDLKRLNREPEFAKVLKRKVNGEEYELPPNSNLYVLPIPYKSILQSGLEDNPRE